MAKKYTTDKVKRKRLLKENLENFKELSKEAENDSVTLFSIIIGIIFGIFANIIADYIWEAAGVTSGNLVLTFAQGFVLVVSFVIVFFTSAYLYKKGNERKDTWEFHKQRMNEIAQELEALK